MCGKDIESANHFFFQCSLFLEERQVHMNKIREIGSSLIGEIDSSYILTNMLTLSAIPFLLVKMNDSKNAHILNAAMEFIL